MGLDTGSRLLSQDNEIWYMLVKWLRNAVRKEKKRRKNSERSQKRTCR